ncbi:hypothetical protein D3C72_2503610 [compost metagenome]
MPEVYRIGCIAEIGEKRYAANAAVRLERHHAVDQSDGQRPTDRFIEIGFDQKDHGEADE